MSSVGDRPRTARQLAFSRTLGPYLWARGGAYLGFWAFAVVSAIVMYEATGSVTMVGLITVAQFLPQFVLTPVSGVLADRGHVATQIVAGFGLTASGATLLGGWLLAAGGAQSLGGPVPVLLSSFIVGVGFAVGSTSTAAVVTTLVPPEELGTAIGLNSAPLMGARAAGPALAGALLVLTGPAVACLIAGALNAACAVVMARLRLPGRLLEDPPAAGAGERRTDSMAAALSLLHADRPLLAVLAGAAAIGIGAEPALTLAPALAQDHGGSGAVGPISGAFGVGGVLGLTLLGTLRRRLGNARAAVAGLLVMAAGLLLTLSATLMADSLPMVLAGMGTAGVGMTIAHANNATLLQTLTPAALRGRVTSLWFLCWLGSRPVGAAGIGILGDAGGTAPALAATITVLGVAAGTCWWAWRPSP